MTTEQEQRLIPSGYYRVFDGIVYGGDKFWSSKHAAWLPITVNDGRIVAGFIAVIRVEKEV